MCIPTYAKCTHSYYHAHAHNFIRLSNSDDIFHSVVFNDFVRGQRKYWSISMKCECLLWAFAAHTCNKWRTFGLSPRIPVNVCVICKGYIFTCIFYQVHWWTWMRMWISLSLSLSLSLSRFRRVRFTFTAGVSLSLSLSLSLCVCVFYVYIRRVVINSIALYVRRSS